MTEFKTKGKGKDRIVYPVRKKPYGVTRQLAYQEVQALRKQGKKARLIQTNKRLDLYAPYESVIAPDGNEPVESTENIVRSDESRKIPVTVDSVQIMTVQINEATKTKGWGDITVSSREGMTYVGRVSDDHIMMIYEVSEGTANVSGGKFTVPRLDFSDGNSSKFELGKDQQIDLMRMIRENRDADDIVFHKPAGGYDAYVFLRGTDEDRINPVLFGEPMKFMMQNSNQGEYTTHLSKEYFMRALKAMRILERENRTNTLSFSFRQDYPVEISGEAGDRKFAALIAPKMTEFEGKVLKAFRERIGGGQ